MQKIIPTIHILSKLGLLFALMLVFPTLMSYAHDDDAFFAFSRTAEITVLCSCLIWFLTRKHQRELRPRDGFTLVTMLWLGFAIVAAMPLYLFFPEMSFTDAYFESMSGLTTTGATVITGLDQIPPSINFWRHLLNWLGGMGIIVLAVAILPMLGVGGTQLFKAEIPGIEKDNKMAPRISQTAKQLWLLYLTGTIIVFLALMQAGMTWFDALCHAMSAFALGGFSTHDNGIAHYDSVAIEIVITVATIIGGINFANHFAALRQKTLRHYWKDEEVRTMLIVLISSIVLASLYLFYKGFYSLGDAFRYVTFNYVSIGLASGFANANFANWPLIVSLWMFFLSNILANTGSMGGGIKLARAIALAKFTLRETTLLQHPNAVRTVKVNGRSLNERLAMAIMAFIFVYFMTVVLFVFVMMLSGLDFITALTAVIACITNAGPALGSVGPAENYSALSSLQKWLLTTVMLLGRLEIFTVFMLFTPGYWKK
ncbi:potassium transporter TrkG [Kingella kingae]|uniref:TrkH family potassium uptake protein n=1 Tax=Kingella kingae TaxID=504 RepID=UPI0002F07A08|nr:potassium transporter TrkG [Kingella kingae]MDK4554521.1 potassium transporter TrkG [Kingella kingae]MDK4583560.1 potassium transporter TrkG [Kingella kingae]MDK4587509.1 potassium transporter TrkG [Kingella kingae]MDK4595808.1 potassium transporter TrkG [Kingella kingae]MDK4599677.1 potassium transporter TrkG [Kingella kingae]